jgi:hypothetical protein
MQSYVHASARIGPWIEAYRPVNVTPEEGSLDREVGVSNSVSILHRTSRTQATPQDSIHSSSASTILTHFSESARDDIQF